jgi:imidazolonepropionase-like amidohydrolase
VERVAAGVVLLLTALSCGTATAPFRVPGTTPLALVGASVLPMTTDTNLREQTIVIRDGKIVALGPSGSTEVPSDARVIDLHGKFVMPGLVDMHVHNAVRDAALYVPAGITTVRNMWGFPALRTYAASVGDPTIDLPSLLAVSPGIDGHPQSWPYTRFLEEPAKVRDSLTTIAGEGWVAFKIYDHLPLASFDSVLAIGREKGIDVVGHVPFAVDVEHALAAGIHEIEHLTGYERVIGNYQDVRNWTAPIASRYPALVQATVSAKTWNCATLAVISEIWRQQSPANRDVVVQNRRAFVKALYDGGARLIIGTDSGIDIVPAGSTIFDEIDEHVLAGIPRYAVLRAATTNAAESVRRQNEFGAVGVGLRADLLVLDGNPLNDHRTLRTPRSVVLRGAWIGFR